MTNRLVKWTCPFGIFILIAGAAYASPQQDAPKPDAVKAAAQARADQNAAVAAEQRAELIQDLYDQIRRIEDATQAAEQNAQQAEAAANSSGYIPSKDPAVAAQQAAAQANAQNRASNARAAVSNSSARILELTNEIASLEDGLPIGSIDRAMDSPGSDKQSGTWKLDLTQSKFAGTAPKAETEKVAVVEGGLKSVDERINADGSKTRTEWVAKFDAKNYAVKGGSNRPSISLWQLDDGSLQFIRREAGKMTAKGQIVCSPDGKSRTVKTTLIDPQGKQVNTLAVWTKQ